VEISGLKVRIYTGVLITDSTCLGEWKRPRAGDKILLNINMLGGENRVPFRCWRKRDDRPGNADEFDRRGARR
jgi:hypothetical protein